jgi:hypothetical protein
MSASYQVFVTRGAAVLQAPTRSAILLLLARTMNGTHVGLEQDLASARFNAPKVSRCESEGPRVSARIIAAFV